MTKPKGVVEAALIEIGKQTSLQLAMNAKESVAKIQQDAEAAITALRETGAVAIREVRARGRLCGGTNEARRRTGRPQIE